MGVFDVLYDGETEAQIKLFHFQGVGGTLAHFKVGDELPVEGDEYNYGPSFTIVLPGWEDKRFALVKDKKFVGFTDNLDETWGPYWNKWGHWLCDTKDEFHEVPERWYL